MEMIHDADSRIFCQMPHTKFFYGVNDFASLIILISQFRHYGISFHRGKILFKQLTLFVTKLSEWLLHVLRNISM